MPELHTFTCTLLLLLGWLHVSTVHVSLSTGFEIYMSEVPIRIDKIFSPDMAHRVLTHRVRMYMPSQHTRTHCPPPIELLVPPVRKVRKHVLLEGERGGQVHPGRRERGRHVPP